MNTNGGQPCMFHERTPICMWSSMSSTMTIFTNFNLTTESKPLVFIVSVFKCIKITSNYDIKKPLACTGKMQLISDMSQNFFQLWIVPGVLAFTLGVKKNHKWIRTCSYLWPRENTIDIELILIKGFKVYIGYYEFLLIYPLFLDWLFFSWKTRKVCLIVWCMCMHNMLNTCMC